jgi:hypothetical protein
MQHATGKKQQKQTHSLWQKMEAFQKERTQILSREISYEVEETGACD